MQESLPTAARTPARRLLCLAGFMGAGKTSVGRIVARQLGWRFVDLDERIVEAAGTSIRTIFETRGEPAFRQLEHEMLERILGESLAGGQAAVIALGGGTVTQERNLVLLRKAGAAIVWLDCPIEAILDRCAGITDRPLFGTEDDVRRLYDERRPFYERADGRVESDGPPERVAEQVLALEILAQVRK
jgi:shikimate kinase